MLDLLHDAIERLPALLADGNRAAWNSVDVTYHPPHVERLWIQVGECRLFLHRIYPCEEGRPLAHPHPWPAAVRIVSGVYEHKVGHYDQWPERVTSEGWEGVRVGFHPAAKTRLPAGAEYEMTDRFAWHSVRPLDTPSDSIMIAGPPYDPPVEMPEIPTRKQGPLTDERFDALYREWQARFP